MQASGSDKNIDPNPQAPPFITFVIYSRNPPQTKVTV